MVKALFNNVNWLSVKEIAEMWSPQLKISPSTIERELRIALYKLEQEYPFDKPIDINPDTVDLPSPDTLIDRNFIEQFHDKQLWKLPDFWFEDLPTGPSFAGRPSVMAAIVQELEERARKYELAPNLAEQSRQLSDWAKQTFPDKQTPQPNSTANGIRMAYNALRRDFPPDVH